MKTFAKIAGGIGLVLVLTSVLTLALAASVVAFAVKLGLGLALIGYWAATHRADVSAITGRLFFYASSSITAVLFVAILVAVNFITARRAPTFDVTQKKLFSLAPQTKEVLAGLKGPVKAITFFPGAPVESVESLYRRYNRENDKFTWEFKDPQKVPDLAAKYRLRDGQGTTVLTMGDGADEKHITININKLADEAQAEQELTRGIVKLTTTGEQKTYFVSGHGEWPLEASPEEQQRPTDQQRNMGALKRTLDDEGYAPESLNLVQRGGIPQNTAALVIAGARSKFTDSEKLMLEAYLDQGGRLLYFAEQGVDCDLDALLARYGVQVDPGVVADAKMNAGQPYLVVTPYLGDSPIVKPLKQQQNNVIFASTRSLTMLRVGMAEGVSTLPLVVSGPGAWVDLQMNETPTLDPGEKSGNLVLAAQIARDTGGASGKRSDEARLIVMGDADILIGSFGYEPNRNLVLNSFAWVTQQISRITIRPPDRDVSTIDIDPTRYSAIRLVTLDLMPTLLIAVGLTIARTRRAR